MCGTTRGSGLSDALEVARNTSMLPCRNRWAAPSAATLLQSGLKHTDTVWVFAGSMRKHGTKHKKRHAGSHKHNDGQVTGCKYGDLSSFVVRECLLRTQEQAGSEQGQAFTAVLTALFEVVFRCIP